VCATQKAWPAELANKNIMQIRKDIQILRGIAVLLVVFFHLEVPGFSSGFLGVDVFFVISGYLMAIMYDPSRGRDFFVKRARRLLPAYFATIILTLAISAALTTPLDYKQTSKQAWFASVFASNIGFWMENSYFEKATFKPLLHLWSLGVEIQFYLLLPLLAWIFNRVKFAYLGLMVTSALLCFVVVGISSKTSFFMVPLRLWEFLIGYGVAVYISNDRSDRKWEPLLGCAGLVAMLFIPFGTIDGSSKSILNGHPGIAALLICSGTAAVLSFGLPQRILKGHVSGFVARIGDYSYSIYLAHFPVIVLFLYQPFHGTVLRTSGLAQSILLSFIVASLSLALYHFIERPGRTAVRAPFRLSLVLMISVFVVSYAGLFVKRYLVPPTEMLIYDSWDDRDTYRCGKLSRIVNPFEKVCEITNNISTPSRRILLVGNSHADSIKTTFKEVAEENSVAVYFLVENQPLMKTGETTPQALIDIARSRSVESIVLHYAPGSVEVEAVRALVHLAESNHIDVAFVMPVPVWEQHIPMALLDNIKTGNRLPIQSRSEYLISNKALIDGLGAMTHDRFMVYRIDEVLCVSSSSKRCLIVHENGKPLYFDNSHLTLTGSALLRNVFERVITDSLSRIGR